MRVRCIGFGDMTIVQVDERKAVASPTQTA